MTIVAERTDACVWLSGVSWEDYGRLRAIPESRNVRMTFANGRLELMSPSKQHERIAELLARLIFAWTEERGIAVQSCGTTTFRREDLQRGLEPDKCYYVQHEADVRDRDELDLGVHPPPDVVVEVDVTSPSRDRLPIYAELSVPEVWLWRREHLTWLLLGPAGTYQEATASPALPGFPRDLAERLIIQRREMDETTLVGRFRRELRAMDD